MPRHEHEISIKRPSNVLCRNAKLKLLILLLYEGLVQPDYLTRGICALRTKLV